jgi:hypothetical protein
VLVVSVVRTPPDDAGPVVVPGPVPGPDVGETVGILPVHPAKAIALQRRTRKVIEILWCMLKNASLSYIMLAFSQGVFEGYAADHICMSLEEMPAIPHESSVRLMTVLLHIRSDQQQCL